MTMLAASIQVRWRTAETIPRGTPIRQRDGDRAASEQERLRERGERLLGDLALGEERPPEISPHRGEQEVPVLRGPGLVEPELLLQPL